MSRALNVPQTGDWRHRYSFFNADGSVESIAAATPTLTLRHQLSDAVVVLAVGEGLTQAGPTNSFDVDVAKATVGGWATGLWVGEINLLWGDGYNEAVAVDPIQVAATGVAAGAAGTSITRQADGTRLIRVNSGAGLSAYEVAVAAGFVGDEAAWLASLVGAAGTDGVDGTDGADGAAGLSAYQVAVTNGFVGDEAAWLASLVGAPGTDGVDGTDGSDGSAGLSAYQVAVANGFVGDEAAWLASLVGAPGADGVDGTDGSDGSAGLSAYQVAVANGFVGDEAAWLASLVGAPGTDGVDGTDGTDGSAGLSAYQVAVANGFVGDEAAWLASLVGATGPVAPAVVAIQVTAIGGDALAVADDQARLQIPQVRNGWSLTAVAAAVSTAPAAGAVNVQIRNVTAAVNMLSTALTIDQGETRSADAATPAVINGANAVVADGDILAVDIDGVGTGAKGLLVTLTFEAP